MADELINELQEMKDTIQRKMNLITHQLEEIYRASDIVSNSVNHVLNRLNMINVMSLHRENMDEYAQTPEFTDIQNYVTRYVGYPPSFLYDASPIDNGVPISNLQEIICERRCRLVYYDDDGNKIFNSGILQDPLYCDTLHYLEELVSNYDIGDAFVFKGFKIVEENAEIIPIFESLENNED